MISSYRNEAYLDSGNNATRNETGSNNFYTAGKQQKPLPEMS